MATQNQGCLPRIRENSWHTLRTKRVVTNPEPKPQPIGATLSLTLSQSDQISNRWLALLPKITTGAMFSAIVMTIAKRLGRERAAVRVHPCCALVVQLPTRYQVHCSSDIALNHYSSRLLHAVDAVIVINCFRTYHFLLESTPFLREAMCYFFTRSCATRARKRMRPTFCCSGWWL